MNSPLSGAWELQSEWLNGVMVFTDTHECHLFTYPNRKPFENPAEPTDVEAAEAFRTMGAGGGTYTISGSTVTMNEEYDRIPNNPKRWIFNLSFKDDTLTIQSPSGNTYTLKRVG